MRVGTTVNGQAHEHDVEPRLLLVQYLREVVGLTGTKIGCDTSSCGACTVLVDGESVKSCTMLAAQADGSAITTIEGLAQGDELHPIQAAFHEKHALQCGFCTPGFLIAVHAFLTEKRPSDELTDDEIREAISGNLCRCTGYTNIVDAVRLAAQLMHDPERS